MRQRLIQFLFSIDPASPIWPIARRYAWSAPVVAVIGFFTSLLEGVGISLLAPLLSAMMPNSGEAASGGMLGAVFRVFQHVPADRRLLAIGLAIIALVALKGVAQTANQVLISWVDGKVGHEIRSKGAHLLMTVGYPFYLTQDPARLINIISTETWRASEALRASFSIIASATGVVVFGILLLLVHWPLTLAVFAGVGLIRLLQSLFNRPVARLSEQQTAANYQLADRMLHGVEGMRLIRVFNQEQREKQRFDRASEEVRRAMFAISAYIAALGPGLEMAQAVLFVSVLLGATAAGVNIPVLIAFLVLLYRMQPFVRALGQHRIELAAAQSAVREVESLIDPSDKPAAPTGGRGMEGLAGPIRFERVSFNYPNRNEDSPALDDVTFTLQRGTSTALIGRSGSGKSTVINLLCRLLEPEAGRITIDGVDLREIDPVAWRARIGFAGQDIELIDDTIANNIAYGDPGASLERIEAAARLADIDAFIATLPDGYQTVIGARGSRLSGGQRQRIGIARALLLRPELLILDEATSAVDGVSEAAIMSLLKSHDVAQTILVVSHRASTIAACDAGIVIEEGRIAEEGPLSQLRGFGAMQASDQARRAS